MEVPDGNLWLELQELEEQRTSLEAAQDVNSSEQNADDDAQDREGETREDSAAAPLIGGQRFRRIYLCGYSLLYRVVTSRNSLSGLLERV